MPIADHRPAEDAGRGRPEALRWHGPPRFLRSRRASGFAVPEMASGDGRVGAGSMPPTGGRPAQAGKATAIRAHARDWERGRPEARRRHGPPRFLRSRRAAGFVVPEMASGDGRVGGYSHNRGRPAQAGRVAAIRAHARASECDGLKPCGQCHPQQFPPPCQAAGSAMPKVASGDGRANERYFHSTRDRPVRGRKETAGLAPAHPGAGTAPSAARLTGGDAPAGRRGRRRFHATVGKVGVRRVSTTRKPAGSGAKGCRMSCAGASGFRHRRPWVTPRQVSRGGAGFMRPRCNGSFHSGEAAGMGRNRGGSCHASRRLIPSGWQEGCDAPGRRRPSPAPAGRPVRQPRPAAMPPAGAAGWWC